LCAGTRRASAVLIVPDRRACGLRTITTSGGVSAWPWQMGKVDQGVFLCWGLAHHFRRPLRYIGFVCSCTQVRDLLHVEDLIELLDEQLLDPQRWDGATLNVGGGRAFSLSLLETTALCAEITGHRIEVEASAETRPGDVPLYISDCRALAKHSKWRPRRGPRAVLADVHAWVCEHEAEVYGRWAGRRRPGEGEWRLAAATPAQRRFPWGDAPPDAVQAAIVAHVGPLVTARFNR